MIHRTFTSEDQIAFAELSGDYNPLHVDAVASRRLLFGAQVVPGIHSLLWALDSCLQDKAQCVELHSIKAVFPKPIKLGEQIRLSCNKTGERLNIRLRSGEAVVTSLKLELHRARQRNCGFLKDRFPEKLPPRALQDDEIEIDSGALDLYLHVEAAGKMFPNLLKYLPPLQIAVILSCTRLVGGVCPGLHSVFSEMAFSATRPDNTTTMSYEVTRLDRRFGLVFMKITAPEMAGTIKAFCRPEPQNQANYLSLKHQLVKSEFAAQRALIIGGSRGLGEVTAKLLAGGDAEVRITYHQGVDDAHRIVNDIVDNGGSADSLHFDVLNPKASPLEFSLKSWVPTELYYFATPFIFAGAKGIFSPQLFEKFCQYYISGFIITIQQTSRFGIRRIFYPSTVAIDELPSNMGEYAAAKIASEWVCAFLEKTRHELTIYKPRFPRMATDQTVSILPVDNQNPVPLMIKELRAFRDLPLVN